MRALTCGAVAELLTASIASYPIHCLGSRRLPCWLLACFCTPAPPPARNPAARHTALQPQRSRVLLGVTVAWRESEECDCARAFGEFSMVIRHAEQSWTGEEKMKEHRRNMVKMI